MEGFKPQRRCVDGQKAENEKVRKLQHFATMVSKDLFLLPFYTLAETKKHSTQTLPVVIFVSGAKKYFHQTKDDMIWGGQHNSEVAFAILTQPVFDSQHFQGGPFIKTPQLILTFAPLGCIPSASCTTPNVNV